MSSIKDFLPAICFINADHRKDVENLLEGIVDMHTLKAMYYNINHINDLENLARTYCRVLEIKYRMKFQYDSDVENSLYTDDELESLRANLLSHVSSPVNQEVIAHSLNYKHVF
jgi:hypothetical protein